MPTPPFPRETKIALASYFFPASNSGKVSASGLVIIALASIMLSFLASLMFSFLFLFPEQMLIILITLFSIAIGALLLTLHVYNKQYIPQKIEEYSSVPPPQLSSNIIRNLNTSSITNLSHTHENSFFTEFESWRETFLRNPEFLLNSALASWYINPSETEDCLELYRDYTKFSLILTSNTIDEIRSAVQEENHCCIHQISQQTAERHAIPSGSKAIRTVLQNVPYILPILPSIPLDFSTTESLQISLYQIFRCCFSRYYLALNHSISQETTLILRPLSLGHKYPIAQQMEWLALLCAIEQLRFVPTCLPRTHSLSIDASNTPLYILSPVDYWSIFVHKDLVSFSREASYFGLVDHPSTLSHSMSSININRARYTNTCHIILADISTEDTEKLFKFLTKRPRPA